MPEPFLGIAPVSNGRLIGVVDAYGSLVESRWPGPAARALIANPRERQEAGTVDARTGVVVWAAARDGRLAPPWEGRGFAQSYVAGSNALVTRWQVGRVGVRTRDAVDPREPVLVREVSAVGERARLEVRVGRSPGLACSQDRRTEPGRVRVVVRCRPKGSAGAAGGGNGVRRAIQADRRWLSEGRRLRASAPRWARRAFARSLLVLRALVDGRTGAVPASPRDHWHHVWARDAALSAIALARTGHRPDARRIVRFLRSLDLDSAARFDERGRPVPGRPAAGDARGWLGAARRAVDPSRGWRPEGAAHRVQARDDWWENGAGERLGNAIASGVSPREILRLFGSREGLRHSPDRNSGLDAAAAWAIVPFRVGCPEKGSRGRQYSGQPRSGRQLCAAARRTLLSLARSSGPYGIRPGTRWSGPEPWTAPTAWTAWSLAELGEKAPADRLLRALRRAATPAGTLPERVDRRTGVATSATPLAWSHAALALALLARYG